MLFFLGIFAAGISALLLAQHFDIECVGPQTPAKMAQPKAAVRQHFGNAITQS